MSELKIECRESGETVLIDGIDIEMMDDGYVSIVCDGCKEEIYGETLAAFLRRLEILDHFKIEEEE